MAYEHVYLLITQLIITNSKNTKTNKLKKYKKNSIYIQYNKKPDPITIIFEFDILPKPITQFLVILHT
jgi:hypothetical protein